MPGGVGHKCPLATATLFRCRASTHYQDTTQVLDGEEGRIGRNQPRRAVTEADGAFRFDTLFPGYEFRLTFQKGKKRYGPDYQKAAKHTVAKHGDERKLGDVTITPREGAEE